MSEGLWMLKDPGEMTRGEVTFDNHSRINVKRPLPWLRNGSEAELIPMKKQTLEDPRGSLFVGVPPSSAQGNMSGFNFIPTQLNEKLLNSVTTNSDERYFPPNDTGHLITGRDPFDNISSFGLSVSHSPTNSMFGIDYGGIRKVKVSEVRESEKNFMPTSSGPSHSRDVGVEATSHGCSMMDNSNVSMFPTYDQEDANAMKSIEPYGRNDNSFLSIRQSFSKGDGNEIAVGHKNKDDNNIMPMSLLFSKSNFNIKSMVNQSNEGDGMISMRQVNKGGGCVSASNNRNYKANFSSASTAQSVSNCESLGLSVGHPLDMGESDITSFSGHHNDDGTSARMIGNYNSPQSQSAGQSVGQRLDTSSKCCTAEALSVGAESSSKWKEDGKSSKKIPLNNFPSNVRSLLSTGILDEVPVKYTAWSREVLPGIIKGPGYLCGCQSCNFSKVINAYEFERHAGCKTKHPNNHIHFDNGKTIYGVVQELKSTPPNLLFNVIQSITGSPINQKAFRLWKESFLAATRELERIYSKDERKQFL